MENLRKLFRRKKDKELLRLYSESSSVEMEYRNRIFGGGVLDKNLAERMSDAKLEKTVAVAVIREKTESGPCHKDY